jgi:hypothetical protein
MWQLATYASRRSIWALGGLFGLSLVGGVADAIAYSERSGGWWRLCCEQPEHKGWTLLISLPHASGGVQHVQHARTGWCAAC